MIACSTYCCRTRMPFGFVSESYSARFEAAMTASNDGPVSTSPGLYIDMTPETTWVRSSSRRRAYVAVADAIGAPLRPSLTFWRLNGSESPMTRYPGEELGIGSLYIRAAEEFQEPPRLVD